MLLLTASDLRALLTYPECLAALEEALSRPSEVPPRQQVAAREGVMLVMPAFQAAPAGMGVKLVSLFERNLARGLDRIQGLYIYLDAATGQALALMDGGTLTAIRTAAVSALATRCLANPGPATLAVFGTGVQARAHLKAMRAVRPIARVLVCGRTAEQSRSLAAEVGGEPATVEQALQANLICTCTTSARELWDGAQLRDGTHINAVGNFRPAGRELDEATVRRARLAVDTREGAFGEAGDLLLPIEAGAIGREHVVAELAEIVRGEKQVRRTAEEITVFKSVGHALQDLAVARLAFERARVARLGMEFAL